MPAIHVSAAMPGYPTAQQQQTVQIQAQQQQPQQQYTTNGGLRSATPSRLASKYGDGFVTSASHPELAQQYGNVGTR
jgi:protein transport protein SEC31